MIYFPPCNIKQYDHYVYSWINTVLSYIDISNRQNILRLERNCVIQVFSFGSRLQIA